MHSQPLYNSGHCLVQNRWPAVITWSIDNPFLWHIDGLVQETRNSRVLAMELHLSCTNSSIYASQGLNMLTQWPLEDLKEKKVYRSYFQARFNDWSLGVSLVKLPSYECHWTLLLKSPYNHSDFFFISFFLQDTVYITCFSLVKHKMKQ